MLTRKLPYRGVHYRIRYEYRLQSCIQYPQGLTIHCCGMIMIEMRLLSCGAMESRVV